MDHSRTWNTHAYSGHSGRIHLCYRKPRSKLYHLNRRKWKSLLGVVRLISVRHIPYINTHHPIQTTQVRIQLVNRRNTCQEPAPVNKWLRDPDYLAQYGLPFRIEYLLICKRVHHSKASTLEKVNVTVRPVLATMQDTEWQGHARMCFVHTLRSRLQLVLVSEDVRSLAFFRLRLPE